MIVSQKITQLLSRVPGKQRFATYRFLPFFFILGGAMEWFMINVRIGKETFYDVYRRKKSERQYTVIGTWKNDEFITKPCTK